MSTTRIDHLGTPTARTLGTWAVALLCGMASYIDAGAIVSTSSGLVLYQARLGLSAWTIGALSGTLTLLFATGSLVGGPLADRFGRRPVYLVFLTGLLVGQVVMASAQATWMLSLGVVITGFSVGGVLPTSLAIIADEVPEDQRGKMISFSGVLWLAGIVMTIILATAFGSLGVPCARILFGHLAVVAAVLLLLWLTAARDLGRRTPAPVTDQPSAVDLGDLLRRGPARTALIAVGAFYLLTNLTANSFGQYGTYLYVHLAGCSVSTASAISLGMVPLTFGFSIWAMRIADRPVRWRWYAVAALAELAGLAAIAIIGVTTLTLVLLGLASTLAFPLAGESMYKVWTQELFAPQLRATAQGTSIAVARFAAAGFAVVTPALLGVSPRLFFALLLALTGLGLAIAWVMVRPRTRAAVGR